MNYEYLEIQELLQRRADLKARLKLLPYEGTLEVKEQHSGKYLYVRRRAESKMTSTYVGVYSDDLYAALLRYSKEAKELKKEIRPVEKRLTQLGYAVEKLSDSVLLNNDFARVNIKANIYNLAAFEGIVACYTQIEDILENKRLNGVYANDVQKVLNLKRAWEFVTDLDVIATKTNYNILCHIARLVNEGFYADAARLRGAPVAVGVTFYIPPLQIEFEVKNQIAAIMESGAEPIEIAIQLCLYFMKAHIFNDGNELTAVIFANHYLIRKAGGLLVIPEKNVLEFKRLLDR